MFRPVDDRLSRFPIAIDALRARPGRKNHMHHRHLSLRPRSLRRDVLFAGTSAVALLLASSQLAQARMPGVAASATSAASVASESAAMTAQQAAAVGRQSAASMARAMQALQTMQALQSAAQAAAQSSQRSATLPQVSVPNGLTPGGLQVAPGATPGSSLWVNANAPTQSIDFQRPDPGRNYPDRRTGDFELAKLQCRRPHHIDLRPAGQSHLGRAQSRHRRHRAEPDPRQYQRTGPGLCHQPERHHLRRRQPDQCRLADRLDRRHYRQPVPTSGIYST